MPTDCNCMTVYDACKYAREKLEIAGIENSRFESMLLVSKCKNITGGALPAHYADDFGENLRLSLDSILNRRLNGEPLQYILGSWEFYSLDFKVGPGVLIPRPETELICDEAISYIKKYGFTSAADLCAGSGCIGIAVAKNTGISVTSYEKYTDAYDYLCKNIALNLADTVTPVLADITKCDVLENTYDIILSNPPYIPDTQRGTLQRELDFEPQSALFTPDGLEFYRCIRDRWLKSLKSGGALMVEIGVGQCEDVKAIFSGRFKDIRSVKDLSGIDRVIIGTHKL